MTQKKLALRLIRLQIILVMLEDDATLLETVKLYLT